MLRRIFIQSIFLMFSFLLFILSIPSCKDDYLLNSDEISKSSGNLKNNSSNNDNDMFICCFHHDKPKIIKLVQPEYPISAQNADIEGTVVVRLLVDTLGNVEKTEILKSIPLLDQAAVNAAKQIKFEPAKLGNKSVKVWMAVPFEFKLD